MIRIKNIRSLIQAGAILAASFSVGASEHTQHWGYKGPEAPAHWGKLSPDFALCETGKNQSPVNVQGALETNQNKLVLAFQQGSQQITNNGHTIQVNVGDGNTLQLGNKTSTLQQVHFHAPSENNIDDKQFPLEGHFVYKDKNGSLTVLALMFDEGKANPQLAKAWQQMPVQLNQNIILTKPMDLEALLPGNLGYYRFSGSLTTPPCSEGVTWIVLEQFVSASDEQIRQFSSIHYPNNRPIQPLNGRIIVK